MSYNPKTNWQNNEIVEAADMNRIEQGIENSVEKVAGKGLSENDYTTTEKTKLAGIATGANKYTHPANHPPSIITQDANNRFVTDSEKAAWNAKQAPATTLSGYGITNAYTKTETDTKLGTKVDKVTGKSLSTNDYDNTAKGKVDNCPADTNTALNGKGNTQTYHITDVTTLTIPTTAWVTNTVGETDEIADYPYMAMITIANSLVGGTAVTDADGGEVMPSYADQTGGNFSQNAYTVAGGIKVQAKEIPTDSVVLKWVEIVRRLA